MQEVFHKYKAEFEAAAKLDAKSLKNDTPETAPPSPDTMPSLLSNFQPVEVKKLEQHLPINIVVLPRQDGPHRPDHRAHELRPGGPGVPQPHGRQSRLGVSPVGRL